LIGGDTDAPRERVFAYLCAAIALVLGTVDAYGSSLLTYAGRPAGRIDRFSTAASDALTAVTALTLVVALARARGLERQRIVWIVATFLFAGAARLSSDELFPRYIPPWLNGVLVSATIVPIVGVWIAVVRQHFFNVDFVVSRAIVYVALTAAAFGTVTAIEELGTYVFYKQHRRRIRLYHLAVDRDRGGHGQDQSVSPPHRGPLYLSKPPRSTPGARTHRGLHSRR
jgi:hypothetical protein